MKVDRSLFLGLTASIAAGAVVACQIHINDATSATGADGGPLVATHAPANGPAPRAASMPRTRPRTGVNPVPVEPSVVSDAGTTPATTTDAGTTTACVDNGAATLPSCAAEGMCTTYCTAYTSYFKPKVAEKAIACAKTSCGAARDCGLTALRSSCTDANYAQACQVLAAQCKTTATDCSGVLSGLNDVGLQKVAACAATGRCGAGLQACVDTLFPSAEATGTGVRK